MEILFAKILMISTVCILSIGEYLLHMHHPPIALSISSYEGECMAFLASGSDLTLQKHV